MRFVDLAVFVHQQISAIAVQHAGPAAGDGSGVHAGIEAVAGRLDAENFDPDVVEERMEQAHGVGAATDAGDQRIRQPASASCICSRVSRPMIDWKSRTIIG